jgi:RNA polymerase sigma-70 factor (family 1)
MHQVFGNQNVVTERDDAVLIGQVRNGDRLAFEQLYRRYWKFVYHSAYKQLHNTDHAKDIAQDVFTQFWLQLSLHTSDTPIASLKSYLYVAVRNHVFKFWERERKYVPIPDLLSELDSQKDNADAQMLYEELFAAYRRIIDDLPSQQKLIFKMRYHQELSSDQIAMELNLSSKTVRNQLGKALVKIRTGLLVTLITCAVWPGS